MTATLDLTPAAIAAMDTSGQLNDILGLPDQLRDALWRVESAQLETQDAPGGMVVAGMGGSAIGGSLARAVLGDRASRPIGLACGYALPAWTTPEQRSVISPPMRALFSKSQIERLFRLRRSAAAAPTTPPPMIAMSIFSARAISALSR